MFETVADYGAPVLIIYIVWQMFKEISKWMKAKDGSGESPKAIETATKQELDDVRDMIREIKREHEEISFARDSQGRPRAWSPSENIDRLSDKIDELKALIKGNRL